MPQEKTPPPAGAPLKPQGTGGRKRTPTSAFNTAAGKDEYEPEKVIAELLARGTTQYQVGGTTRPITTTGSQSSTWPGA